MSSRCEECEHLKQLYTDAVNTYGKAVNGIRGLKGLELERKRQLTQEADQACKHTQLVLLEHQRRCEVNAPHLTGSRPQRTARLRLPRPSDGR